MWKELEKNSGIILFIDLTRGYRIIYNKSGITEEMEKFKARIAREYRYCEVFEAWIEKVLLSLKKIENEK
ncbi:hypothetical protein C5S30_04355 [ANME-1 cluster archaeon GoMg4]|nr:hypothetical protein [ANME-1 cluster archaeon GoMg4]